MVHQNSYTQDLIKLSHLTNKKQVDTSLELNMKYSEDKVKSLMTLHHIVNLFGGLIYLIMTHPNITVQVVSQLFSSH